MKKTRTMLLIVALVGPANIVAATHKAPFSTERSYEFGQIEGGFQESLAWTFLDTTGFTLDGSWDLGGAAWMGCQGPGSSSADPSNWQLPCVPYADGLGPYDSASVFVDDAVNGPDVGFVLATCSNDGDRWCGETDNIHQPAVVDDPCVSLLNCPFKLPAYEDGVVKNGGPVGGRGPNELLKTGCGSIIDAMMDPSTAKDGTGPGIWDQAGEQYEDAGGVLQPHPGVAYVVVFLGGAFRGPQFCPTIGNAVGATAGAMTLAGK